MKVYILIAWFWKLSSIPYSYETRSGLAWHVGLELEKFEALAEFEIIKTWACKWNWSNSDDPPSQPKAWMTQHNLGEIQIFLINPKNIKLIYKYLVSHIIFYILHPHGLFNNFLMCDNYTTLHVSILYYILHLMPGIYFFIVSIHIYCFLFLFQFVITIYNLHPSGLFLKFLIWDEYITLYIFFHGLRSHWLFLNFSTYD
jgi:hypothetical protein